MTLEKQTEIESCGIEFYIWRGVLDYWVATCGKPLYDEMNNMVHPMVYCSACKDKDKKLKEWAKNDN